MLQQTSLLRDMLAHWCSTSGLYSKQTFVSLFGCLIRMLREHRMHGLVISQSLGDDDFKSLTDSLAHLNEITFFELPNAPDPHTTPGLLLILTDRLCSVLYWKSDTEATFQMYEGGWTFHPTDVRRITDHVIDHLPSSSLQNTLRQALLSTKIDRRFDDRLSTLIPSLVNGLEQRNRELTLTLNRLQDLHKRMVEAERLAAIGQLSAVIAHEIRNPLGLIDLYAKLTETQLEQSTSIQQDEQAALMKPLQQIRLAASHLETFLSELTDFSKPFSLNQCPTQVYELLERVVEFCQPLAQQHGITLAIQESTINNRDLTLRLDAPRIQQALLNLIKNAIEASPSDSSIQVVITNRKQDDTFFIKVIDQGTGMSRDQQTRLFTPFFTTKQSGTGLGLARSQKILEAHGGNVQLLSSSSKGSTFALVLPKTLTT